MPVRSKDVSEHANAGIRAPQETTADERGYEENAIDELSVGACELHLVAKPVDVEEGRREFVEDEVGGVVVHEWSLYIVLAQALCTTSRFGTHVQSQS